MATLLADPPAAPPTEQPPASAPAGATPPAASPVLARSCANCGSAMDGAQDWCLQCGAGAPDSLASSSPGWRSAATILGAIAILVAGAATAAYAALNNSPSRARPATATVAQTPAPTPGTPTTPGAVPTTPTPGTPTTIKPLTVPGAKPPKIPLVAATPKIPPSAPSSPSSGTSTPSTTSPKTTTTGGSTVAAEQQPSAILLDTNAAATYDPYGYPPGNFGDPSLAIDGDASTGWTAQVDPAVAPRMAEGLVIDLKSGQKLSALALITASPGMTVQVYGANGHALPASITDSAWVQLSPARVVKKKHVRIKLHDPKKAGSTRAYRFVTLWVSKAPAASVGTAEAPGHVSVDELGLFPAKK